jgi:hypothetical protein
MSDKYKAHNWEFIELLAHYDAELVQRVAMAGVNAEDLKEVIDRLKAVSLVLGFYDLTEEDQALVERMNLIGEGLAEPSPVSHSVFPPFEGVLS